MPAPRFRIRRATALDTAACARVCLLTGRYGADGTDDFPNDPYALSRIYTTPYLLLEPSLSLVLVDGEDSDAVVGYCLAALDTTSFFARYDADIRPGLAAQVPPIPASSEPTPREASIHRLYTAPDYTLPDGLAAAHPSHLHIDLLPCARRAGWGSALMRLQLAQLARRGTKGVHLCMAATNAPALSFYRTLGFTEFARVGVPGDAEEALYLAKTLGPLPARGPAPYPGQATNVASYAEGRDAALACGDECLGAKWVAVTMPDPWWAARDRLGGAPPLSVLFVDSVHETALDKLLEEGVPADAEVVAGIGGGMAVDAAKYFAWRRGLRLVTIPTALTVDAFVTPPAGVRRGGEDSTDVVYIGSATPDPLIIDFELLRTAPAWLNVAGVGDILSCHTACADWERAHAAGRSDDHPFSAADVAAARAVLAETLAAAADISANNDAGLRLLVHAYMRINALCLPAGHPRVEEGCEHFVLYVLESRLKRGFLHGHIVGLGIYLMARLQGNDAEHVTRVMRDMGLRFDPVTMDLTREDVRSALLALPAFRKARPDLYYTAIDEEVMDEEWVDKVLGEGDLVFKLEEKKEEVKGCGGGGGGAAAAGAAAAAAEAVAP
jgi:glycerol dehydrogenase-like iron-containing ADH family enzyme/ribosomal protein S18 acetylase RimI-like enzyme